MRILATAESLLCQNDSPGVSGPDSNRNISPTSLSGPKKFSGLGSDLPGSPGRLEPGPEILGPHNDLGVWSLSSPGRCLVLLQGQNTVTIDNLPITKCKSVLTNLSVHQQRDFSGSQ